MALIGSERVPWQYTDDTGKIWRVIAREDYAAQGKQGGAAAAATDPAKPANLKMRRCTVHAAGKSRTVPLYSGSQTLVVGTALGTIDLEVAGATVTMTAAGGIIAESRPRSSVGYQTS